MTSNGIYYRIHGESGPWLLMISGLGGHASFWSEQVAEFSSRFRVVVYDHRGCGQSDKVSGKNGIEEMARDAMLVLNELQASDVRLVGHSMGGMIAQSLIVDHPERFSSVILSGTFSHFDRYMEYVSNLREAVLTKAGVEAYSQLSALLGAPAIRSAVSGEELNRSAERSVLASPDIPTAVARMRAPFGFDRRADLARSRVPAMIVGAADDMLAPFYHSEELAAVVPGAILRRLDGGHFFPRTRTEVYNSELRKFMEAA